VRDTDVPAERTFQWLYVSIVDLYKHQWVVAEAAGMLRDEGLTLTVDFIGPAYAPALRRLRATMRRVDPEGRMLRYRQAVPHAELPRVYQDADAFVFASSCENMPNILLEAMAASLPIACSDRGAMPEVLDDAGERFDPEDARSTADAMRRIMTDPQRRRELSTKARERALEFTWSRCAHDTFAFLRSVAIEEGVQPMPVR
jgi:glycosyltransferase involved in cell wall biosynthesis